MFRPFVHSFVTTALVVFRLVAMRTILLRTARAEGCILAAEGPDDSEEDHPAKGYSDQQNDGLLHIHTRKFTAR